MAKVISICIPKGGVGKTTTAVNLAASLALAEKRTLLIDVDPFGGSAIALGYTPENIKGGLFEIFNFSRSLKSVIHKTDIAYLDFVPSNIYTIQMYEKFNANSDSNKVLIKNSLREVAANYDYIIFDCPPILKGITNSALIASNSVLMPVKCAHFSLDSVDRMFSFVTWFREVSNPHLNIEGIVLTMYEKDSKVTKISERELKLKYKNYLLNTVIPNSTLLNESTFYGKPLCLYRLKSEGAEAYLELAYEIITKNKPNPEN